MLRTLSQNKQLYGLFNTLRIDEETKLALVAEYSAGRTFKSSELEVMECKILISFLQKQVTTKDAANTMRRKMLSIAYQLGWTMEHGKLDLARVNNWCVKYGYMHKPLNDYTVKELPQLITQFERI
jgi:hypothetical protein